MKRAPLVALGVGSVVAFERTLDGRVLTFARDDAGRLVDRDTGSVWRLAVAGEFRGKRLAPAIHYKHCWSAWRAFFPRTKVVANSL